MSATITASVLYGPKDLRNETRSLPPPSDTSLQVAIRSTGICGSDLHYYRHGRNGDIILQGPLSLGHESAGEVVAVGAAAASDGWKVGDRVALEVGLPCGECRICTGDEASEAQKGESKNQNEGETTLPPPPGRYNLCPRMRFRSSAKAVPHFQGTLQERINHPAAWCHKLPDSLEFAHGALVEPLSVALQALNRAGLAEGTEKPKNMLVIGAGAVGALVGAALRIKAPKARVVISDVDQGRLDFAKTAGYAQSTFTVPLKKADGIDEKLEVARETAGLVKRCISEDFGLPQDAAEEGYDFIFECTGVEASLQTAIYAARPGGKIMLIGMGTPIQTLPISAAALREVDLVGVFRYRETYGKCIELIEENLKDSKAPDLSRLVTHRVAGLGQVEKAFEIASKPVDPEGKMVLKVVIDS